MRIDNSRDVIGIVFLLGLALIGIAVTKDFRPAPEEPVPEPQPVELVCPIKASHPAMDGGRVLTIHCPPQVAEALGLMEDQS